MKFADLKDFDYVLPPNCIAQRPASPRDSAKMLVYNRKYKVEGIKESIKDKVTDSAFNHLPEFLDDSYVLVCNDTKVIPARIWGKRATGGKVEVLFIEHAGRTHFKVMLSRFIRQGETLTLQGGGAITVIRQDEKYFFVDTHMSYIEFIRYLNKYGTMPVPPYIDKPDSRYKLKQEYQTVFAKHEGSVAAPTASLHFTNRLLKLLTGKGISIEYITLHVGLGTFAPLAEENFETQTLHDETYEVKKDVWQRLQNAKESGKKILAVGTTTLRVLETIVKTETLTGKTNIFITPPYQFQFVDAMITNFHLPATSLLLLIAAFIGDKNKTLDLYQHAISTNYRFYSFGDGMRII
ncbi:MAG: tRNA preQ1(34) S-adenosylmethionine ribosyltransferase-isomerase QueA [Patescibacteria group bacterium]|jgi:S-adenosylmethionine:tRNA ribosyltransferase-isomerase